MHKFKNDLKNYYTVKETKCVHENRNHVSFIHRPEDEYDEIDDGEIEWDIYTACEKCCDMELGSAFCGGNYINFRLFIGDVDMSDKYNLQSWPIDNLDNLSILKFYNLTGATITTFVLRKRDFSANYYEQFFYEKLVKWYNSNNDMKVDKIINALNNLPKMGEDKLWNVNIMNISKFDFNNEYMELQGYNPFANTLQPQSDK